ncbi:pepF/M3 family oligoendopeptidase [Candidatus Magnetobacterium bavaricum]|uniref:PepF/M3 family oligoendopeptidase n=1 Tax=Candidatus Magnetobacterium bavaricum TaxID=29290 RepID=A0A0F3GXV6_9BACT|nr:pepF/M3 family oligoendopeptidase [Candidatus Magnetobacterium bavaricum]
MTNATYKQMRWALNELLPGDKGPELEDIINEIDDTASYIQSLRDMLVPGLTCEDFMRMLNALERFATLSNRLGAYGQLWFSEDTQNREALSYMVRMDDMLASLQNRILFFNLWWRSLGNDEANRLIGCSGSLAYYLQMQRNFKQHTLSEPEEKVINLKDVNGINAILTLYDMITNKYVFELEIDDDMGSATPGSKKKLTRDALMGYVRHHDAQIRKSAYQELFRVYAADEAILSQVYIHRLRDFTNENLHLRQFLSPISVRNLANDVSDIAVEILLTVCEVEAHVFQRYFKLKARMLNTPKLQRYDIYAPYVNEQQRNNGPRKVIAYNEAVAMVLDTFREFSPQIETHARRVFDQRHVDGEDRPNKRGGAFCYSVLPTLLPWVLVNYNGQPRQVATIAHEMGHAVHAMMAHDHSVLTYNATLPLAETASVFAEMLLTERLLATETDRGVKREILQNSIDDIYATIIRQAYFVIFEQKAHRLFSEGDIDLNALYMSTLSAQFGDAVDVSKDFRLEWMAIPHIYHSPFYCYAYCFGELLSLALYQRYKEEGERFKPLFLKILSYGGSKSPDHILSEVGIDISDPAFWRSGFRVIETMIHQLEVL